MAFFKTIDILKRDNAQVLIKIVSEQGEMTIGKKADGLRVTVGCKIEIKGEEVEVTEDRFDEIVEELKDHCLNVKGSPPRLDVNGQWIAITQFFKDPRFVPKAKDKNTPDVRDKEFQQRQEKSLVEVINQWSQPVKVDNFKYKLTRAIQAPEIGPHGKENLVDVVVWDEHNFSYNVSCKMSHAADLGSGGIAGLQRTVPDLVEKLFYQVKIDLYGMGFQEGNLYNIQHIPTFLYSIPYTYAYRMFQGSPEVGGPIDYLYIGPDKVEFKDNKLNGDFIPVEKYAKKKPYYLRLRKRNVFNNEVKINFTKKNSYGLPCIYTSGVGDFAAARFVVDDRVPPKAIVRQL